MVYLLNDVFLLLLQCFDNLRSLEKLAPVDLLNANHDSGLDVASSVDFVMLLPFARLDALQQLVVIREVAI